MNQSEDAQGPEGDVMNLKILKSDDTNFVHRQICNMRNYTFSTKHQNCFDGTPSAFDGLQSKSRPAGEGKRKIIYPIWEGGELYGLD